MRGSILPAPEGGVDLPRRFAEEMGALIGPNFPSDIGLAVSGGGDSMAMLHLAALWARVMGVKLWVATVDHGLRAESAGEAALVAQACAQMDLPHSTLKWLGWDGTGNLQAAARQARHSLLNQWRGGVAHILFAHTQDDQAETFLMRLARGSGVEGLSGMMASQTIHPPEISVPSLEVENMPPKLPTRHGCWTVLRPLLTTTRAELRHYNRVLHVPFVDDPTNEDTSYDRVKARKLLDHLSDLGLSSETLARTAGRMSRTRVALEARAQSMSDCILSTRYEVQFDRTGFEVLERDTQLRLLARALQSVASNPYRPRENALEALLDRVLSGGDGVLHGGHVLVRRDIIWVIREFNAVKSLVAKTSPSEIWDKRFRCSGQNIGSFEVRAVSEEGLVQIDDLPKEIPRKALRVTPAIFDGATLIGCFRLGYGVRYVEEHRANPPMFGTTS